MINPDGAVKEKALAADLTNLTDIKTEGHDFVSMINYDKLLAELHDTKGEKK